jgi:hypothetical protein
VSLFNLCVRMSMPAQCTSECLWRRNRPQPLHLPLRSSHSARAWMVRSEGGFRRNNLLSNLIIPCIISAAVALPAWACARSHASAASAPAPFSASSTRWKALSSARPREVGGINEAKACLGSAPRTRMRGPVLGILLAQNFKYSISSRVRPSRSAV